MGSINPLVGGRVRGCFFLCSSESSILLCRLVLCLCQRVTQCCWVKKIACATISGWRTRILRSTHFIRDGSIDFSEPPPPTIFFFRGQKTKSAMFVLDPYQFLLFSRRGPQNVLKIVFTNVLKMVIFIFGGGGLCPPEPPSEALPLHPTLSAPGPHPDFRGYLAEEFPSPQFHQTPDVAGHHCCYYLCPCTGCQCQQQTKKL